MSQDLTSSNAVFSTVTMLPEAGEWLAAAWARALCYNTGWLAYREMHYPPILIAAGTAGDSQSLSLYQFVGSGIYVVGCKMADQPLSEWHGSLHVDGTAIMQDSFQAYGTTAVGTIAVTSNKWVLFKGDITVIDADPYTYRISSWLKRHGS